LCSEYRFRRSALEFGRAPKVGPPHRAFRAYASLTAQYSQLNTIGSEEPRLLRYEASNVLRQSVLRLLPDVMTITIAMPATIVTPAPPAESGSRVLDREHQYAYAGEGDRLNPCYMVSES